MVTISNYSLERLRDLATITPIAIFTYNRPAHTERLLSSLSQNELFLSSPLFFFCDGPEEVQGVSAVRDIVHKFWHPNKKIVARELNLGLAESIISGVNSLLNDYGRVIVLEDDLVVSEQFLTFMCSALDFYKDVEPVMQISGHSFENDPSRTQDYAVFLPFISSWGWGTWERSWKKMDIHAKGWERLLLQKKLRKDFDLSGAYPYTNILLAQQLGLNSSWAIRWNWSVFNERGLVLYPPVTLVRNDGHDGSGTHCRDRGELESSVLIAEVALKFPSKNELIVDPNYFARIQKAIQDSRGSSFQLPLIWALDRLRFVRLCIKIYILKIKRSIFEKL